VIRRLAGAVLAVAGAAGLVAALECVSSASLHVIRVDGGSCGSDGTYVPVHQCSSSDVHLLVVGLIGGLVATVVFGTGSSLLGGPSGAGGLSAWIGGFGLLGYDFLRTSEWISGAVFVALAAGGAYMLLSSVLGGLRRRGRPDPLTAAAQPLVRAATVPGVVSPAGGGGLAGNGIFASQAGWSSAPVAGAAPTPISGLAPVQFPATPATPQKPRRARRARRRARPGQGPLGSLSWLVATAAGGTIGALASATVIALVR
jgi:hypothetical protein